MNGARYLEPRTDALPDELRALPRWVTWRAEGAPGTKPRKVPYCPTLPDTRASSTDPATWGTFAQAEAAYLDGDRAGIGFALNGDGIAGVDIDGCVNADTGEIDPRALALLERLGAGYVELSPSGTGLRALGYAPPLPAGVNGEIDGLHVELYSTGRYLTLTGCHVGGFPGELRPLRHFAETAERIRNKPKPAPGAEPSGSGHDAAQRLAVILAGSAGLHDALRDEAGALVAVGMPGGAAVAHLRRLMDAGTAQRDERWHARRDEIPRLVTSAQEKYAPQAAEPARVELPEVPLADIGTAPPEPQEWLWDGYVPAGHVTLLAGHGGAGKSLLGLMLATAAALGLDFLGRKVERVRVLFFSAEDGAKVIRRRAASICRAWGIEPAALDGWLHAIDASELDAALFAEQRAGGVRTGALTPTYDALAEYIGQRGIRFVVVDNASDVFDADEIARSLVRQFMRHLRRLVVASDGAVLLLAHVDKLTSRAGKLAGSENYSGSTAWHNSARSRLFLLEAEPGVLELQHQKSQFGPKLPPLRLRWPDGGLPYVDDAPGAQPEPEPDPADERRAVLRLVHEFTQRGEWVSTATIGAGTASALLRTDSRYPPRLTPRELVGVLRDAERHGVLRRVPFMGANRKPRERWELTPAGAEFIGEPPIAAAAV